MSNQFDRAVRRDLKREARRKNRAFRVAVLSVVAALLWVSLCYFSILGIKDALNPVTREAEASTTDEPIYFANKNWDEDIEKNERYLQCDRNFYFGTDDGTVSSYRAITTEDTKSLGEYSVFFYNYFQSLKDGDAQALKTFYSKDFLENDPLPEAITRQKLYEVYALEYQDATEYDTEGNVYYFKDFIVKYKILENDGTFRDDLPSGVSREQAYRLVKDENGEIVIHTIVDFVRGTPHTEEIKVGQVVIFSLVLVVCLAIPVVILKRIHKQKAKEKEDQ